MMTRSALWPDPAARHMTHMLCVSLQHAIGQNRATPQQHSPASAVPVASVAASFTLSAAFFAPAAQHDWHIQLQQECM